VYQIWTSVRCSMRRINVNSWRHYGSGSVNVVTLAYISLVEEHLGAHTNSTMVLNPASLEPLMLSVAKSDVLHWKKLLIPCFVLNVCQYSNTLQKACPLLARDQSSLEFTTTRVFMKIFCTCSSVFITECQPNINFLSVQWQFTSCTAKFLQAFAASDNHLCSLFENVAVSKLNCILTSFKSTSQLVRFITMRTF